MHKILSAQEIIRTLGKGFGFRIVSQKGSHIKMKKNNTGGSRITIVPNHKDATAGTLKGVLRLARIDEEEFWKSYYNL